jgi:hypothetical protein
MGSIAMKRWSDLNLVGRPQRSFERHAKGRPADQAEVLIAGDRSYDWPVVIGRIERIPRRFVSTPSLVLVGGD